ncbi:putative alpha-1,2-mannosidase [Prevotella sp. DNF00663]|uniref:GH92 family glycosyl hydrolase n=1 Tax=unclassified Prevotella TaxID=2638335 RepID=UPI000512E08A|nr:MULTISPECIES: GH92 family glycosyl hydrolase [unclassified Prevotella]KGI61242.1 alpha-mannosidase [Prevotella sp. S7 MS 2]KXB83589.1 putative alpha-1,2-mannosidase [Prevotella sp. DNF00663]
MILRKKILLSLAIIVPMGLMATVQNNEKQAIDYVNPMIGAGGHGHVFVGANVPFGFVQLGPTEYTRGWDWCSGYHYSDSVLVGFGHTHLSGTGIGDLGDIAFLPVADKNQKDVKFSHAAETVRPGYYTVKLQHPNVLVELTATKRAGFHRYYYGANVKQGLIALNLKQGIGWDKMTSCKFTQDGATTISGYRMSSGWAKNQQMYFAVEFSQPVKLVQNQDSVGVFAFENNGTPLLLKVGLSAVSVENARENLKAEIAGWNFNQVVADAQKAWQDELSRITVQSDNEAQKTIFYTAMYHTMTAPSVFSDVNGQYRGADGQVHSGNSVNYTTFSLWDTYRSWGPLMTLIQPKLMGDVAQTFMNIYREQGKLPVWHLVGNETDCMVGNPGSIMLADLVLKGFVKDRTAAFEALKNTSLKDDRGQSFLKQYNYIPYDKDETMETVAKTMEYAIADAGVAKVAKLLGKTADYKLFTKRSQSYRNLFDPTVEFMRGRDSKGIFRQEFNPFKTIHRQDDYTEGNAWQYTWLVPQDVHGLVNLFPSEKAFVNKFDSLFVVTGDLGEEASPDISGLIGQYAHGNEPSHHVLYMYNYVGQPWKGAKLMRQTMDEMYTTDIDGLSGNEDVGAMSAWYVISSMGLYQVDPSGGKYVFGSPIWNEATLNVGSGKTFRITTVNNSKENIYIQSVKLNGKKYTKSYINYTDIVKGGTLEFTMGNKPSTFGTAKKDRP